jgi:hypothetical protein
LDGISVATLKVEAIFVADIYIDARVALASGRGCVGYGFPEAFMTAKFGGQITVQLTNHQLTKYAISEALTQRLWLQLAI